MTGPFFELNALGIFLRIAGALGANILLAGVAYRKKSVSPSGAVVGFILGAAIFLAGGFSGWIVLGVFFVSSTIVGKLTDSRKHRLAHIHEKGSTRDGMQAFSNAGPAALSMVGYLLTGQGVFLVGFLGSMATANGDTWSSELGVLSKKDPVSLLTLRRVVPGTSGAVSLLGFVASALGSLLIVVSAIGLYVFYGGFTPGTIALVFAGGIIGGLFDSLLGALLQGQYKDLRGNYTEKPVSQGTKNTLVRGFPWMNNDLVNLISNTGATIFVMIVHLVALSFGG